MGNLGSKRRLVDWARERILVIGGSGFLGANIVHDLVARAGALPGNIRTFSNRITQALDDLPDVYQLKGDILDASCVAAACLDRTLVFHAAGSATFDPRLKRLQWLVNVEGTRNVLEAVRFSCTIRRLCYTSTVNVLGCPRPDGALGTEESCNPYLTCPRLHSFECAGDALALADEVHTGRARGGWWKRLGIGYFDSKLAAQELVNRAARTDGLDAVSVLPGTAFGCYGELGDAAELVRGVIRNSLPVAPRGGLPLVHASDVARGHVLAMERGRSGGVYIISGRLEDNLRHAELMRTIAEVVREEQPGARIRDRFLTAPAWLVWMSALTAEAWSRLRGQPIALSRQVARVSRYALFYSYGLAEKELEYRPERTFREAVRLMCHSLRSEGTS